MDVPFLGREHADDDEMDPLASASLTKEKEEDNLRFSFWNEVSFFFRKGIPLGLSSILEWGVPPWVAMIFAGQTEDSVLLQASLGYGRVFYNTFLLMPMLLKPLILSNQYLIRGGC